GQAGDQRPARARPLRARARGDSSMSAGARADEPPLSAGAARARQIELEAARRRVIERLKTTAPTPTSATKRAAIVGIAALLFAVTFAARVVISDPDALLANFYILPVAVLAIEFGTRGGLVAAAV